MEINIKQVKTKEIQLDDVLYGQLFIYQNELFIKVDKILEDEEWISARSMKTGEVIEMEKKTKVILPKKVNIEYEI